MGARIWVRIVRSTRCDTKRCGLKTALQSRLRPTGHSATTSMNFCLDVETL